MQTFDVPDDFYVSFTEFLLSTKHQIVALSAEYGLTSMQALTLLLTTNEEPRPMNVFGKLYGCDVSNITGIIDGLEQKRLVSRQPSLQDRRIKIIHLEPAGAKLRKTLAGRLSARSNDMFPGLDSEELHTLVQLVQKIARTSYAAACPTNKRN